MRKTKILDYLDTISLSKGSLKSVLWFVHYGADFKLRAIKDTDRYRVGMLGIYLETAGKGASTSLIKLHLVNVDVDSITKKYANVYIKGETLQGKPLRIEKDSIRLSIFND